MIFLKPAFSETFMQAQLPEWDLHVNLQQFVKNLTKFKTHSKTKIQSKVYEKSKRLPKQREAK